MISLTGEVSRGFARSMTSILPRAFACLRTVAHRKPGQPPAHIYVTGHSLGGALAQHFTSAVLLGNEYGPLGDDVKAAISGPKHDLKLVLHWSTHDRYYPFWDFDARRDSKDLVERLEQNGYRPKAIESDDGIGWGMWQGRMAEILEALFPLESP